MTAATFVLLSGALTFGVPLVLAIRELLTLRPSPPRRGGDEPPPPWLPRAPKPLPACLLPRPVPVRPRVAVRVRVLEDA